MLPSTAFPFSQAHMRRMNCIIFSLCTAGLQYVLLANEPIKPQPDNSEKRNDYLHVANTNMHIRHYTAIICQLKLFKYSREAQA